MFELNDRPFDRLEQCLEQRLELRGVAVPWQRHHHLKNRPAEALDRQIARDTHLPEHLHGQQRDVLAAAPQRRHVDADLCKLLVQIAPQAPLRERHVDTGVECRDRLDVEIDDACACR